MTDPVSFLIIIGAALASFSLSFAQAGIAARHGTDQAVYTFLIRRIRENGFRTFVRIPRLLNEAYIGALPLYLPWLFAHVPPRATRVAEKLLNPLLNLAHTLLLGCVALSFADAMAMPQQYAALATALFALTPQFYHALSARNFGLSARSIGLVLLTLAWLAAWSVERDPANWAAWGMLVLACYLTWACSTFGAQALVIVSGLLAIATGHLFAIIGAALGLAVFITIHPHYSLGYLYHTWRFIRAFAVEMAPVYVLARHPSLWRDLVRDIWRKFAKGPIKGFRYAYENGLLIVLILNPLIAVTLLGTLIGAMPVGSFLAYAYDVTQCGTIALILTSFRTTRFLGEPERYVEAVSPWAALAGTAILLAYAGQHAGWILVAVFLLMNLAQLAVSRMLFRHLSAKPLNLDDAAAALTREWGSSIRCAGNNEQYLKLMLINDWHFAYCIGAGHGYCDMTMGEAFESFPFLRREALERITEAYRLNSLILDRTCFDTVFDILPPGLHAVRILHESDGLRVLALDWEEPMSALGSLSETDGISA